MQFTYSKDSAHLRGGSVVFDVSCFRHGICGVQEECVVQGGARSAGDPGGVRAAGQRAEFDVDESPLHVDPSGTWDWVSQKVNGSSHNQPILPGSLTLFSTLGLDAMAEDATENPVCSPGALRLFEPSLTPSDFPCR